MRFITILPMINYSITDQLNKKIQYTHYIELRADPNIGTSRLVGDHRLTFKLYTKVFDDDLTDLSSGSSQRRFWLSNDWENIVRFESITPTAWPMTPRLVYNWTRNEKIDFFFYALRYENRRRPPRNVREDSNFGNWIMDGMSVLFVRFVQTREMMIWSFQWIFLYYF